MQTVIAFGELLIDFLRTGAQAQGELEIPTFAQFPGGAPANVAVAVARLGGRARFAGGAGSDVFGEFLIDALERYGVSTRLVRRFPQATTALAFVTLDATGERSFSFRREATADLCLTAGDIAADWFEDAGFLHVCSNLLVQGTSAAATHAALALARRCGVTTSIDLNLRLALWRPAVPNRDELVGFVASGDIVKLSREEAEFLAGGASCDPLVASLLRRDPRLVVITDGARPIHWFSRGARGEVLPPATVAVDTTAAGDAFAGGLLFALARRDLGGDRLAAALESPALIDEVVRFAARCGAASVRRPGAFPSMPTLADLEELR